MISNERVDDYDLYLDECLNIANIMQIRFTARMIYSCYFYLNISFYSGDFIFGKENVFFKLKITLFMQKI